MGDKMGGNILTEKEKRVLGAVAGLGAAAFLLGLRLDSVRAWGNLLLGNFYFAALSIIGMVFIAIQYAAKAGWHTVFRRIPEAMSAYLPVGAALTALLFFGMHDLYHWAHHGAVELDPILRAKAAYLNVPGYFARAAVFFILWYAFSRLLRRESIAQDQDGRVEHTERSVVLSCVFLPVFAVTFSLASIDWIMSLEPHWYSTIFPWYVFTGAFVHGVAGITLLLILLRRRELFQNANRYQLHDLGKYLFAFSVFWAYLWFSQYLLIWYSNIPEETVYYVARSKGAWPVLFWLNPIINFALPFFLLTSVRAKRSEKRLLIACGVLFFGHWLDLYLMIMPSLRPAGPIFGWPEVLIFLGLAAIFLLAFDRAFRKAAPVPLRDPYLAESVHHRF